MCFSLSLSPLSLLSLSTNRPEAAPEGSGDAHREPGDESTEPRSPLFLAPPSPRQDCTNECLPVPVNEVSRVLVWSSWSTLRSPETGARFPVFKPKEKRWRKSCQSDHNVTFRTKASTGKDFKFGYSNRRETISYRSEENSSS